MSGKRRNRELNLNQFQDPGKDLFAFLFLMVMIFSFMVLISGQAMKKNIQQQDQSMISRNKSKDSTLEQINNKFLGRLVSKNNRLFIVFDQQYFDPITDISKMESKGYIQTKSLTDGTINKRIFLERNKTSDVLLEDYLCIFQTLSRKGIAVAFSERLN